MEIQMRQENNDTSESVTEANKTLVLMSSQREEESVAISHQTIKQENQREPHWVNLPSMLFKRSRFGSAIHNNKLYVFGGVSGSGRLGAKTKKAEMFDPQTNSWVELPDMHCARSEFSCSVAGEDIYVIGGYKKKQNTASCDGEIFNTNTKTWSALPPMRYPKAKHSSVTVGDMIYVFGGHRVNGHTEAYDTVSCKWIVKSKMKVRRYECASAVVSNKIFAIGGKRDFQSGTNREEEHQYHRYLETMEEYDIEKDEWTVSKETMKNRRAGCSAVVVGSVIKVLGGYDEKEPVISIEEFDTLQRKWSGCSITPPKTPRKHFSTEITGDRSLVVIGGYDDSDLLLNSVEKYSFSKEVVIHLDIPEVNKLSNIDSSMEKCPKYLCQKRNYRRNPVEQKQQKKHDSINQESHQIKKRKASASYFYKGFKVAKDFDGKLTPGFVKSYDVLRKYWTVEYEDGDEEELDQIELKMAIELYDDMAEGGNKKKMRKMNEKPNSRAAEHNNIHLSLQTESRSLGPVNNSSSDGSVSLKQQVDAKLQTISALEKKAFGEYQEGSLQSRYEKLVLFIENMEKEVFREAQTGNLEERLEKVKSFLASMNIK